MKPVNKYFCVAVASMLLASAGPSHAAISGNVSLTNIRSTLFDLNTSDGISPSFNIVNVSSNTTINVDARDTQEIPGQSDSWESSKWLDTNSLSANTTAASAHASSGSDFLRSSGTISQDGGHFSAYPQAPYFGDSDFTLTPHTRLVMTGDASLQISMDARPYYNAGSDEVSAAAGIFFYAPSAVVIQPDYYLAKSISFSDAHEVISEELSKSVTTEIINNSDQTIHGKFYAYAAVYGSAAISAVPEPTSSFMLLTGLCAIGLVVRRNKQVHKN